MRAVLQHLAETSRSVSPDCLVVTNAPALCTSVGLSMTADDFPVDFDPPEDRACVRALGDRRPAGAGRASSGPAPHGDKAGV